MPRFEVTAPDGSRYEVNAPQGATEQHAISYIRSQMANQPKAEGPAGGIANALGPAEAALSLGTGAVGALAGQLVGIGRTVTGGKFGTPEGVRQGAEDAKKYAEALTYRPRTELGQKLLEGLGKVVEETKIAGLGPTEAVAASALAPAVAAQVGSKVAAPAMRQVRHTLPEDVPSTPVSTAPQAATSAEPAMAGFGSAMADVPAMRAERAAQLPVPIQLTKGQATRDFAQQQFERETAKNAEIGLPLRRRYDEQNDKIIQNFDAWIDDTGAEAGSLRAVGEIVTNEVARKANRAKLEIKGAYDKAEKAGETREPVAIGPLQEYLEKNRSASTNAPVLSAAEDELKRIAKDGFATINDLEEVRKTIGKLGKKDPTNALYAKEIKAAIDGVTENAGGDEYKRARALRTKYGKEFNDIGVIKKLLSTKPGSSDRSVAYEDVFNHSILGGSLDDVRAVRRTLQTAGPSGEQAWKELQGQTIRHIKDQITKNVSTNSNGQPVVSAANLNKLINELDSDGKLDFVFGKKGAEQLRDINNIAKDVFTAPPGSINTSNTASIVLAAIDGAMSGTTGLPLPVGTASKFILDRRKKKRVQEALN